MGILKDRIDDIQPSDKKAEEVPEQDIMTEEDAEIIDDLEDIMSEKHMERDMRHRRRVTAFFQLIVTLGCVYMVFLIFGVVITGYTYDQNGKVVPVVLSVSDLSAKNEYNKLLGVYLQERELYEEILTLDYRVASGVEDSLSIAPEYEEHLDAVSNLATQIEAMSISSEYNQIVEMMLTWVKTHMAAYCQYMSAAISQNDESAAQEAIACREVVNSSFQQISQNLITIGQNIQGTDLSDLENWSPDSYVSEEIEGVEK